MAPFAHGEVCVCPVVYADHCEILVLYGMVQKLFTTKYNIQWLLVVNIIVIISVFYYNLGFNKNLTDYSITTTL